MSSSLSTNKFNAVHMILTKRENRRAHTEEELQWWMEAYTSGAIPEYQMSAWLMAVCWRGMTRDETSWLTQSMVQSGQVMEWNVIPDDVTLADKHSTGGVGDKISLVLAPLVVAASHGKIKVPMMAGRGLDHTGGTLDKLESIPGYQVHLEMEQFQDIVNRVGCSIASTTKMIVPADSQLYALRDVTGTVSSIPLQTASIVSKKVAENPNSLVLDVKYGRAAFQRNFDDALLLAQSMIYTAESNGVSPTTAFLTRMDVPIGDSVGNWLEVRECLQILRTGQGAPELMQLITVQAAQMLFQSNNCSFPTFQAAVDKVVATLQSGMGFVKFRSMVQAHGGDVSVLDHIELYPKAKYEMDVVATHDGFLADIDALIVGRVAVDLGAGRHIAHDVVEPRAGIWFHKRVTHAVQKGDVICTLYTQHDDEELRHEACRRIQEEAIQYSTEQQPVQDVPNIISHMVTRDGVVEFEMPNQLL